MMSVNELSRMTTEEAGAAITAAQFAILPIGATEQHGPHLEVRTDATVAWEMGSRVAQRWGSDAILCPLLPYGLSEHHLSFPGTLSLRPAGFIAVVHDVIESLANHGIRKVLIINGHGGNTDALRLVARQARHSIGSNVAHVMWGELVSDLTVPRMQAGHRYHHACEFETSLIMTLDPTALRTQRLENAAQPSAPPATAAPRNWVDWPVDFAEWTTNGSLGFPTNASGDLGAELLTAALDRIDSFIPLFLASATPAKGGTAP